MPVLGYRSIVDGLIRLHEANGEMLGDDRGVSLPALTVTVEDMMAALRRVAGNRHLGEITIEPDPFIEAICLTSVDEMKPTFGLAARKSVSSSGAIARFIKASRNS